MGKNTAYNQPYDPNGDARVGPYVSIRTVRLKSYWNHMCVGLVILKAYLVMFNL